MVGRVAGIVAVVTALAGALASVPPGWVEQYYARGWFPPLQRAMTAASNTVPFALIDALFLTAAIGALAALGTVMVAPRRRRLATLGHRGWQTAVAGSLAYLWFLAAWGANYRRAPMTDLLDFDAARVTPAAVVALNEAAIGELHRLRPRLPTDLPDWPDRRQMAAGMHAALLKGTTLLGLPAPIVPGRPKTSLIDPYFTRAGVSGMTGPFFLETLIASNLLPCEVPAVLAHEWGHLAGLARESDASFFGIVVCLQGGDAARYSAWLDVFERTLSARGREDRRAAVARLPESVRADLRAMAERSARDQVRALSEAAWRTYDTYLRAQRVESGVRNYGEVVRLLAGTRFGEGWKPVLRAAR